MGASLVAGRPTRGFLTEAGSDPAARRYHVETIEPDGRNRRRVTQRSGNYWGLAWAPVPAGQP